jgi:hypothetical protein
VWGGLEGAVDEPNKRRIGTYVNDIAENGKVGLSLFIHGTDERGAFETAKGIDDIGTRKAIVALKVLKAKVFLHN